MNFSFVDIFKRPFFPPLLLLIIGILIYDAFWEPTISPDLLYKKKTFQGTLVTKPKFVENKAHLYLRLIPSDDVVRLTVGSVAVNFHKNDVVQFRTKLKEPLAYKNPGVFDYARFLKRQGIVATGFVQDAAAIHVVNSAVPGWLEGRQSAWKGRITNFVNQSGASPEAQAILLALLWGDGSLISPELNRLFQKQGLSHLLVISGLNFSAVALCIYHFLLYFFKLWPRLFLFIPAAKIIAPFTLVFTTLYFYICEPSPSLTRAYVMVVCYLLAILIGRKKDILNLIFFSAFMILVINPFDLFSISFQLSFVAVLSLVFIHPWLQQLVSRKNDEAIAAIKKTKKSIILKKLRYRMVNLFLATLAIFLGLTPLLVFYFYEVQWNSLFMNLWAVPCIELLLVPLVTIGLVFSLLSMTLASVIFSICLRFIDGFIFILVRADAIFPEPLLVFPPRSWELALYYFLVIFLIFNISRKIKITGAVVIVVLMAISIFGSLHLLKRQDQFKITHLDVGQGDSLLVELPHAKRLLIDGGGSPYFDIGKNVLLPFLLYQRFFSLDAVVVTHADTDHYLGLLPLLKNYPIKKLWWNGIENSDEKFRELFTVAREKNIKIRALAAGDVIAWEDARIEVLHPSAMIKNTKDNNQSLVLKIRSQQRSALFTGDIEQEVENSLVRTWGYHLQSDYLKIPHHGSRTSSHRDFLKTVSPQLASVSSRFKNPFGHPHKDVLQKYTGAGIEILRTDTLGAIEIELKDKGVIARPAVPMKGPTSQPAVYFWPLSVLWRAGHW